MTCENNARNVIKLSAPLKNIASTTIYALKPKTNKKAKPAISMQDYVEQFLEQMYKFLKVVCRYCTITRVYRVFKSYKYLF